MAQAVGCSRCGLAAWLAIGGGGVAEEMSAELVAYYRTVLATHATAAPSGVCAVCNVRRCPDWLDAFDKLASARQLMAEPEQWERRLRKKSASS